MSVFRVSSGLLILCVASTLPLLAAAPRVHTQPFHQSPVRGGPDDLLMLPGQGFLPGAEVAYRRLVDTTAPLAPPAGLTVPSTPDEGSVPVVSVEPLAVVVRLPLQMLPDESYALWIRNPGDAWSEGIRINDARPHWVTPAVGCATASPARPASAPRGLKVVGRNLDAAPGEQTRVRLTGPATLELTAADDGDADTAIERYVARVDLPPSMAVGLYDVEVSRDGASWVAVPDQQYEVRVDPAALPQFNITDPLYGGCAPGDGSDDALCIQSASDAASAAGGGDVVLPAGLWELISVPNPTGSLGLAHGIIVQPGVNLIGAGHALTTVLRTPAWGTVPGVCDVDPCVIAVITVQGRNTVTGIHFDDAFPDDDYRTVYLQLGKRPWWSGAGDPTLIEDVIVRDNRFTNMHIALADGNFPLRRVFVVDNIFQAYKDSVLLGGNSFLEEIRFDIEDSVIASNLFYPGDYYAPEISQGVIASQIGAANRMDFSDNVAEGRGSLAPPTSNGDCNLLPTGCGWRAAHFWHMNNNHERMIVANNVSTCTGDKAGDGEAIVFDNNQNEPGLDGAQTVLSSSATTVTVPGPLRDQGPLMPGDFYFGYWMQIADGPGVGQARKITGYLESVNDVMFGVTPPWDVVPVPGSSKVTVLRQDWQILVVDNHVDIRGCEKDNPTEPRAGILHFHGNTVDSVMESNVQYETDGIRLNAGYSVEHGTFDSWAKLHYFNEIRDNLIAGEYNFNDCAPSVCTQTACAPWTGCCVGTCDLTPDYTCDEPACCDEDFCYVPEWSWSGIEIVMSSDPDSPSPVIGYGNVIAHNVVSEADALRGGGIAIDRGWHPPPTPYLVKNTLIHHNALVDIERLDEFGACMPFDRYHRDGGAGIHVEESYTWNTMLYENSYENVCYPVVDNGTDTIELASSAPGSATLLTVDRISPTEIELGWSSSGCAGALDHAIYEGAIGTWNDTEPATCTDTASDLTETLTVTESDRFFVVVPLNLDREGSYGLDGSGIERMASGVDACYAVQDLSCP